MSILSASPDELDAVDFDSPRTLRQLGRELRQHRQHMRLQRQTWMPVAYVQAHQRACDFYAIRFGLRRVVRRIGRAL